MATIQSTIKLFDGYSPIIRNMVTATRNIISALDSVQDSSRDAFDASALNAAKNALLDAENAYDDVEKNVRDSANEQRDFNKEIRSGAGASSDLLSKFKSLAATVAAGIGIKKAFDMSDEIVSTQARLNMLTGSLEETQALQDQIFASAVRARGAYQDTADTVAKLGLLAGDAFNSNDEIVAFAEILNKQFTISGTEAANVGNTMRQITQALASGVLRGDELNSVFENAPTIIQDMAKYLDVPVGQVRELAAEGKLTADVMKKAMFKFADETNAKFEQMPMTIGQIWTEIKNYALKAFEPVLLEINNIVNNDDFKAAVHGMTSMFSGLASTVLQVFSTITGTIGKIAKDPQIQNMVQGIISAFSRMKTVVMRVINTIGDIMYKVLTNPNIHKAVEFITGLFVKLGEVAVPVFQVIGDAIDWVLDNLSWIAPVLGGVVSAFVAYNAVAAITEAVTWAITAAKTAYVFILSIFNTTAAAATAAQWGLNAAMYANPIGIIIGLVVALIVAFVMFTEQVVGAVWWLGALFKNIGLWVANLAVGIWNTVKNIGQWFKNMGLSVWAVIQNIGFGIANFFLGVWESVKAIASNIATAFENAWIWIQEKFWSMVDSLMSGLKSLVGAINDCLGWLGVEIDTSGFDFAAKKVEELAGKYKEYQDIGDAFASGSSTYEYKDVSEPWEENPIDWGADFQEGFNTYDTFQEGWGSDAYAAGAAIGADIHDQIMGIFDMFSFGNTGDTGAGSAGAGAETLDLEAFDFGAFDVESDELDSISGSSGDTAANTAKAADALDYAEEDLKYMRDIAEREAVNRYTTAEIRIEQNNENHISSEMDLDGVIGYLNSGLEETIAVAGAGVHY